MVVVGAGSGNVGGLRRAEEQVPEAAIWDGATTQGEANVTLLTPASSTA